MHNGNPCEDYRTGSGLSNAKKGGMSKSEERGDDRKMI